MRTPAQPLPIPADQALAAMRADQGAPADLRELTYCEHLLIWSFRAFAVGRWRCAMIEREYRDACGSLALAARNAVEVFAQELQLQGRRQIILAPPGVPSMTRDEQLLLAVFAAAHADDEERANAHLSWLLGRPPARTLYMAAAVVAHALAAGGHPLTAQATFRSIPAIQAAPQLVRAPDARAGSRAPGLAELSL